MTIRPIKGISSSKKFTFNTSQSMYMKKIASDIKNNKWLKEQHILKEQEYNKIWNEAEQNLIEQIEKAKMSGLSIDYVL